MATQTNEASSSSSDYYDVFLSFSGTDTYNTFTSHVYHALRQAGFQAYMANEDLKEGDEIWPALEKAITGSKISIPIFSINYATSKWCLNELVKIMECKETKGQTVLPVFFQVEPRSVRKQISDFGEKFGQLANGFDDKEIVEKWKKALKKAGNLKGWDLKNIENGNESKLIQMLVKRVRCEFSETSFDVPENLVGIDSIVKELLNLLNLESKDVKTVGIWGMGGIGKTTAVESLFNQIHRNFEASIFLEDVRENSKLPNGLVCLQTKLLSVILKQEFHRISNVNQGKSFIKKYFPAKRVLIVLDDVDSLEQLEALAGRPDWFGLRSRIIITTRDKHVLNVHKVHAIYETKELSFHQSLHLFSKHAFGKDQPPDAFKELSMDVVLTAGGLPLALKVLGSFLFDKENLADWRSTLDRLKKIPHKDIKKILEISYDGLEDIDKEIFLDIACFFIGTHKEDAVDILDGCGFSAELGIKILLQKSLLKIGNRKELIMHDQLRDIGRHIVWKENRDEPGERSRLWSRDEVVNVLRGREGTKKVRGLILKFAVGTALEEIRLRTKAFFVMSKLRLLQIDNAVLVGRFKKFPLGLRWFSWKGCPLESIPTDFCLEKLVVLDLSRSKIKQVWNGWHQNKRLEELKVINISWCKLLTETPDFSRLPNLEKLNLEGCIKLKEVSPGICNLKSLKNLSLSKCSNLCRLPDSIGNMRNLTTFSLDGTSISELPDGVGLLEKIEMFSAKRCSNLIKLPVSMRKMRRLREFSIDEAGIVKLPEDFGMLPSLVELSMSDCREFRGFPGNFSRLSILEKLNLEGCMELRELPCGICELKSLKNLNISGCSNLKKVEELVGSLTKLEVVKLDNCKLLGRSLDWIGNLRNLNTLSLDGTSITELPNAVGLLENIQILSVRCCSNLVMLPDSMGKMRLLRGFTISESSIVELPEDFGMLSSLQNLSISNCREFKGFPENLGSLTRLSTLDVSGNSKLSRLPNSFSGLRSLQRLNASRCNLSEDGIPSDIGKLSSLYRLDLSYNNFCSLPASIGSLSILEELDLRNCRNLQSLPGVNSTRPLKVMVQNCISLESVPHMSGLKCFQLNLSNCEKLAQIQGIDQVEREYLPRLFVSGCSRTLVNSVKKSIGQGLLQRLVQITFDGSKIPDCFTPLKISSPRTVEWEMGQEGEMGHEWEMEPITILNSHNIIRLFLCFVFTNPSVESEVYYSDDIIDRNGQKHSRPGWYCFEISPSRRHQHQIFISSHNNFDYLFKEAGQISFKIFLKSEFEMEVKEVGMHLVYQGTAQSDYKRIADAISEASSSSRKRTMSQLLYQDGNNHVDGAEASSSSKRKKLQLLHHDDDFDGGESSSNSRKMFQLLYQDGYNDVDGAEGSSSSRRTELQLPHYDHNDNEGEVEALVSLLQDMELN